MARWYLEAPHYIRVIPEQYYEYTETDMFGKIRRHKFEVPVLLHHEDPNSWNYKEGMLQHPGLNQERGYVVVCMPGKGQPLDIEFKGPPTPDMVPLDDEARRITAEFKKKWVAPMGEEAFPSQGTAYSEGILNNLQGQVAAEAAKSPRDEARDEMVNDLIKAQQETQKMLMQLLSAVMPKAPEGGMTRRV